MNPVPATRAAPTLAQIKANQRATWALGDYEVIANFTIRPAAQLVHFAQVQPGDNVLDVATGTGVVALTAARKGAHVTAIDLTPELVAKAEATAVHSGLHAKFLVADAEELPFPDASFDVVLSQFGHMFAPRPEVATSEMLRVLRPGGRIAFATWPPESATGRMFEIGARYLPPPPGVPSPAEWGEPGTVRTRLGKGVADVHFERGLMHFVALSPAHALSISERFGPPAVRALQALANEPDRLVAYRKEMLALKEEFWADNFVRAEYLLTRATKT